MHDPTAVDVRPRTPRLLIWSVVISGVVLLVLALPFLAALADGGCG